MIAKTGLVVPWVTKWSGESNQGQHAIRLVVPANGGQVYLAYTDAGLDERDARGVLWFRDGLNPGVGTPLWSNVHAGRQRRCMTRPCCQVCGTVLPDTDIPWLFPAAQWEGLQDGGVHTATPPTCRDCWPTAERLCPHLRGGGYVRAIVGSRDPYGVIGDVYPPNGQARKRVLVPYTDTAMIRLTLAKQAAVTLHDIRAMT